jgi:hypothetical protein
MHIYVYPTQIKKMAMYCTKYNENQQIKDDEVGETCSMNWRDKTSIEVRSQMPYKIILMP